MNELIARSEIFFVCVMVVFVGFLQTQDNGSITYFILDTFGVCLLLLLLLAVVACLVAAIRIDFHTFSDCVILCHPLVLKKMLLEK